jgi:hypothetical protein
MKKVWIALVERENPFLNSSHKGDGQEQGCHGGTITEAASSWI